MTCPFVYLGILIEANVRCLETWEPIILKFKKRLATWKHKHLLFVERLCLINSVLSSLPLFYLSFFKIPEVVAKILIRLQKRFLWRCEDGREKNSWVS